MKKTICVLLGVVFAASFMFSACAKEDQTHENGQSQNADIADTEIVLA